MNAGAPTDHEVIRQVVRGERPWTDLRTAGIQIDLEAGDGPIASTMAGNRCTIRNPRRVTGAADLRDLAHGLLTLRHAPSKLRPWAFVLEAESFVNWGQSEH